jgi:hypothetical protein
MMKKLLITTALAGVLGAGPALAADTALILWNGAAVDAGTGTGQVALGADNLNGVTVTLSTATRTTLPNGLREVNINIDNTDTTTQTLHLIAGANGYLGNDAEFKLSSTIFASNGASDLTGSFFVDGTDSLNGQTEAVTGVDVRNFDSLSLTGPQSFSFNGFGFDKVTGPFGLAEELTLTLAPGAGVGVQGIGMISVPEPRTWVMAALGFGLLGFVASRKSRYSRAIA